MHYLNKKIKRIDLNIAICIRESFQNGYLQPKDFYPKGTQEVWWECKQCGHDWKGEIKQVEARVRLRSPIIIPVDPYFRYRQHVRIDSNDLCQLCFTDRQEEMEF